MAESDVLLGYLFVVWMNDEEDNDNAKKYASPTQQWSQAMHARQTLY